MAKNTGRKIEVIKVSTTGEEAARLLEKYPKSEAIYIKVTKAQKAEINKSVKEANISLTSYLLLGATMLQDALRKGQKIPSRLMGQVSRTKNHIVQAKSAARSHHT